MNRIVCETIMNAHKIKSDYMRKTLRETLKEWEKITLDLRQNENGIEYKKQICMDNNYTHYYLIPGYEDILKIHKDGERTWQINKSLKNHQSISYETIMKLIAGIEISMKRFFTQYQSEIDEMSKSCVKIDRIIKCLTD